MNQLARHIGFVALVLYGTGDILGAGVYGLVGKAAGQMGSAAWMAFLISMLAAGLTGLSYASIGSRYPRAAGTAYVVDKAFRRQFLSYLVGLMALGSGLPSMATATRVFAGYFSAFLSGVPVWLIGLGFILGLTFVVFWGVREAIWVNSVCTLIEMGGLLVVIFVGASFLGSVDYLSAVAPGNPTGELSGALFLSGAVLTFYSFIGFEDMINMAEEVKEPEKNIPRALIGAILISSCIYILISLIAVSVLDPQTLSESSQPLVDVVAKASPGFPTGVFSLIAAFAVANTALLNFLMSSRLMYGMSREGMLPKFLNQIHSKRKTPSRATFVVAGALIVLVLVGDISALARATSVLLLSSFMIVNISLFVLQGRKGEPRGRFEVPRAVPLLGFVVCGALLFHSEKSEVVIAGAIVAVIVALYFILRRSGQFGQVQGD
ncbi:MAG TPA: APC family permease [Pseudobdellovibrionaceae bacterium]|nr:APC family permease [Pseudobdellovibrionaceae bacterium]